MEQHVTPSSSSQGGTNRKPRKVWNWHPPLPLATSPLFAWPLEPRKIFQWFASYWLAVSMVSIVFGIAALYWYGLQPDPARCRSLRLGCVAPIYLRNFLLLLLLAGGLHLYFYHYSKQGSQLQFDARPLVTDSKKFTWRNQVRDNMFWSLASGVTVWSAYDLLYAWGHARDLLPTITFSGNPIWFVLLFPLIPIWASFHFYWIHRLLHVPFLYRTVHSLHHRNINVGPWSGLSMHPVEHLFYFSGVLIHFLVPSHPLHLLFHLLGVALYPLATHSGFEKLLVKDEQGLALGDFFHQLHHRYFECNYGTAEVPWDRWFGSFHDGTEESHQRMLVRLRGMRQKAGK